VTGTGSVLAFARHCTRLEKFIHLSTTCIAGKRTGIIPDAPLSCDAGFVNAYEQTKWEAEELVLRSGLPSQIVRLATVVGSERMGG
jgi:nucleoside-diphosphate-sugar epimerase